MANKNAKRTGKFYRKNEAEIMKSLGLEPTKNSGSGWIEKEDGQSEHVLCQLKSTDASSISISLKDIQTLEYNSEVARKLPVFAINFLSNGSTYLVMSPEKLEVIAKYLQTGTIEESRIKDLGVDLDNLKETKQTKRKKVGSSKSARELFHEENQKKYNKEKRDY